MNSDSNESQPNNHEILDHEPVPGYRTAFHIIIALASIYLIFIFAASI